MATWLLVLCPKCLRDNWTLYKANDRRNVLASDRFNCDVLNHTDLCPSGGAKPATEAATASAQRSPSQTLGRWFQQAAKPGQQALKGCRNGIPCQPALHRACKYIRAGRS
ncbi:hypothetical protein EGJ44_01220 [Ectopseudomonas oleovorans]|uniref:Uncharacterized protein n=1 Tax=Ectopseudomonas oleovorans TaxID=301 RepID=A0A3R8W4V5_ECTOL|nr:hypothetical protein EGJ44_01220 [Pseudomonas oleovorans]